MHRPIGNEQGIALVVALMSTLLLTALGLGLAMTTMTETMITANYRDGGEAMYAADAGIERVMQDLLTIPDWNRILAGAAQSSFVDGAPTGTRSLPDGSTIDLAAATNTLNCGKTTTCSVADMTAWTQERPYLTNNPRWQLFAYSPIANIIETGTVLSSMYVAVWIADDQAETDDDPTTDGGDVGGRGVLLLRAEAFGPNGASSVIEATVARTDTSELERGYSGQRGQDEQNRRARKKAVQLPGKALTRSDMDVSGSSGGFVVR
ncbi:MAG: PilX N-terminal domain-containing pilus assembly protein [Vicinamibacterales bacterium]